MSLSSTLNRLANYRTNNTRASQDVFQSGSTIISAGSSANLGDDAWAFLEQLTLASIDVGRLDVADECLRQLGAKFPHSPRVDVLTGIRIEATSPEIALQYYDEMLEEDPTNVAASKRRISVLRRQGKYDKAVEELSSLLDTFYTDSEGWLELADIYSTCNQYTPALQALSHALLLSPQNPFTFLQFAETAYTAGDVPLALKMFLVVVEMGEHDLDQKVDDPPTGILIRSWLGVKLCSRQLVDSLNTPSASGTLVPATVKLVDELATQKVLAAYRLEKDTGAGHVSKWLSPR